MARASKSAPATPPAIELSTSRRALFGGAALGLGVTLPAIAAPAAQLHPDAELLRLEKLMEAAAAVEAKAWAEAGPEDDPPGALAAQEHTYEILDKIAAARATTLDGLHVKMRAFQLNRGGHPIVPNEVLRPEAWDDPCTTEKLMVAILADLDAMGRAGA